MQQVFPDYYSDFRCVAGACRHSCCIGWEIDIDPDTMAFYQTVPGEMGCRLKAHIAGEEPPHFVLGEGERCPFLNKDNLCDIILTLGEEHISQICTDHPRFRNELPGRVETGIGLCCEAAGRLIVGKTTPTVLNIQGEESGEKDEILALRDEIISLLQDRSRSINARVEDMLNRCGAVLPEKSVGEWAELLLGLERLDGAWTTLLELLRDKGEQADPAGFDAYMASRQTEYEQLLVYFVYRHLANAFDETEAAARAAFAALAYHILRTLGALLWAQRGEFTFEDQVELARLFSSEIEYSEENMDALLDCLSEEYDVF